MTIRGGTRQHRRRMAAVAGAGLLLIAAAECATAPAPVQTSTVPTAAPVFASDEEALAAATEAYANYLSVYDAYWSGGAVEKDDYLALSAGNAHDSEVQSMADWEAKGWRATGTTTFDSMRLQSVTELDSGLWSIRAYLCADASKGDVVDGNGVSVAKPDRPLRLPLEIEFVTSSPNTRDLKITESTVWSGSNFC